MVNSKQCKVYPALIMCELKNIRVYQSTPKRSGEKVCHQKTICYQRQRLNQTQPRLNKRRHQSSDKANLAPNYRYHAPRQAQSVRSKSEAVNIGDCWLQSRLHHLFCANLASPCIEENIISISTVQYNKTFQYYMNNHETFSHTHTGEKKMQEKFHRLPNELKA